MSLNNYFMDENIFMDQKEEPKKDIPIDSLHVAWWETEALALVDINGFRKWLYGSRLFTKMVAFSLNVNLNNQMIDFWMQFGPKRLEQESYESYKIRMKFQKNLLKYREWLYAFPKISERVVRRKEKQLRKQEKAA